MVEILFGNRRWPPWWGLYLAPRDTGEHAFHGVGFATQLNQDEIWGLVANVAGLRFLLALYEPDRDRVGYHPEGVRFSHADRPGEQTITSAWPTKPYAQYLRLTRYRPHGGEPINPF